MMSMSGNALLDRTHPTVRKNLILFRRLAMQGHGQDALYKLGAEINSRISSAQHNDVAALALLKAEILYLDRREEDALDVFQSILVPRLKHLMQDDQFIIERNRVDIQFTRFDPAASGTFYDLVDRARNAAFQWRDATELLAGESFAAEGNHRAALATFWRELTRTYRQCFWASFYSGVLSRICG